MVLAGMVAALHVGKIPTAIPALREALGMTLLEAGFLLSMVQLAGMLLGVLVGVACEGLGLRRSLISGQIILSIASLGGMWARFPSDLLLLRALEGLGFLLVVLPAPSLIRQQVDPARLARFLGLWGAYMPAGAALALLCGPMVMTATGWQHWWGWLGGLSAAMAAAVALNVATDSTSQTHSGRGVHMPNLAGSSWKHRLHITLLSPGPWLVAVAFAMYSSQWLAVIGFLPSLYGQSGMDQSVAGALTALVCAVNVIGNVGAGVLLQRGWQAQRLLYVGFVSMGLTSFLVFNSLLGDLPLVRYVSALGFSGVGGLIPGTLFVTALRVSPNAQTVSTTVGWMQQCSASGQFLGPPIVAWVALQAGGWHATWIVTVLASVIGIGLTSQVKASAVV